LLKGVIAGVGLTLALFLKHMNELPPSVQQAWQQVRNWPLAPEDPMGQKRPEVERWMCASMAGAIELRPPSLRAMLRLYGRG
jgi:hypothetical protein